MCRLVRLFVCSFTQEREFVGESAGDCRGKESRGCGRQRDGTPTTRERTVDGASFVCVVASVVVVAVCGRERAERESDL